MKKKYMLLIALVIGVITARAQSSFTTIQYNQKMKPAFVLELPNSPNDVEGTILKKLKQTGYNPETQGHLFWKKNKTDGFYVFTNVSLPYVSNQKLDMYFKVVPKNKEETNKSTLYMLLSKGNENFISPDADSALWDSSKMFLDGFIERTATFSLEEDIITQENTVKKSQTKLTTLQKDEKDLVDNIKKFQDNLAVNRENQKDQQMDIANQGTLLENLKLKRKP